MHERQPTTGAPCDHTHPFPAATDLEWVDSEEFGVPGLEVSRPTSTPTQDRDPAPIHRALGAQLWQTDCLDQHVREVADDVVLTAYLLAAAEIAQRDRGHFAFEHGLRSGGFEGGRQVVDAMSREERINEVRSAVIRSLRGFVAMRSDLGALLQTL